MDHIEQNMEQGASSRSKHETEPEKNPPAARTWHISRFQIPARLTRASLPSPLLLCLLFSLTPALQLAFFSHYGGRRGSLSHQDPQFSDLFLYFHRHSWACCWKWSDNHRMGNAQSSESRSIFLDANRILTSQLPGASSGARQLLSEWIWSN